MTLCGDRGRCHVLLRCTHGIRRSHLRRLGVVVELAIQYVQVVRRDSVLGTQRVRAEPDRDDLSELPSGERGHLPDVYVVDEQGIKLRDRPEELVFLE